MGGFTEKPQNSELAEIGAILEQNGSKVEVYASTGATNTAVACSKAFKSLYATGKQVGLHMAAWFGR